MTPLYPILPTAGEARTDVACAAVNRAETLLIEALDSRSAAEGSQGKRVANLIADPRAKRLSMAMTDRLIRSDDPFRSAWGWRALLRRFGLPQGFGLGGRALLGLGALGSYLFPDLVMAAVRRRLRDESKSVILPAEDAELTAYLRRRRAAGWRVNLNPLGEAVLGEEEASRRMDAVIAMMRRSDVDYVSVKVSALFSQINLGAWDESLAVIKERIRTLYTVATEEGTFVNLDMEEYRDLELTATAFRELLDEPAFRGLRAGIVLQAYLPDSWGVQQELLAWARARVAAGGAPIKVRLVKGANLAMESVEAELHGWAQAPYGSKAETDANFKRMLEFACLPENAAAARLGVASHNLFDIALALELRERHGVTGAVEIEMLEGMANHQARAVRAASGDLLVYAPVVHERHFGSALAYLIRRLDENTSEQNFLAHIFDLAPGSAAWVEQRDRFTDAWNARHEVAAEPRRRASPSPRGAAGFENVPDTDFTQAGKREALRAAQVPGAARPLPAMPSLDRVLAAAVDARPDWEARGEEARGTVLRRFARVLGAHRFETIALLREEGKKAPLEADTEVSEAIDFAAYYAEAGQRPAGTAASARGTVVVTPPWNFPFAIPCGGVLAALMAGNTVVLKPAPEVLRIGRWLAELLWEAGVPRDVLQFFACEDNAEGRALITDARVAAVVLTGAYETARLFQSWRPELPLFAETSGKNALVVSALADRDLAIKDLVRSAFGHAGQKCSAASLGILEAEVYDDPDFRRQLRDAAASLAVGAASDPASVVTPLIREPEPQLLRALTTLDGGEEWLLEPRRDADDPCLWSPGIKLGVTPGSWFHQTECFGPVLGLVRARDLRHAVTIQNATPFGLTAGIHSLDEGECATWRESVHAGNLYINRPITGAIVRRQPFGGWKRSSIGPGAKAGGPNYVNLFRQLEDSRAVDPGSAASSYAAAWAEHFGIDHDPTGLASESNVFRYRPCRGVVLRLERAAPQTERLARLAAAQAGVPLVISRADEEGETAFAGRLAELAANAEFLRTVTTPGEAVLRAAYAAEMNWINAPFSALGRIELPRWLREQSVTTTMHRYGNPVGETNP